MSFIFPDEGLDYLFEIVPRDLNIAPSVLYVGLFTSQTFSTVPDRDAVLDTQTGVTEQPNTDGYARQAVNGFDWSAPTTVGTGRGIVGPPLTFTNTDMVNPWATANGWFLSSHAAWADGIAIYYSNFFAGAAVTVAAGDSFLLVPRWQKQSC